MWFMTLVDTNCIMITGMSHSNDPIVQESDMKKKTNNKAGTTPELLSPSS